MKPADPLVDRMFSGFVHTHELPLAASQQPLSEIVYHPLRQSTAEPGTSYRLKIHAPAERVTADSPAIDVMTDLSRVAAVTIDGNATVDEAHRMMIARAVRALFVVEAEEIVRGKMNSSVNRTMKSGIGKGKRIIVVGRKSDDEKTSAAVEKKKSGNDR